MINPHFHNVKSTIFDLRKEVAELRTRTSHGMVKASKMIMKDAQDNAPYDTGNLKASAFVLWNRGRYENMTFSRRRGVTSGQRKDVRRLRREHAQVVAENQGPVTAFRDVVIIGFSAYYAKLIHDGNFNLRYGERRFLEKSLQRNRKKANAIIWETVQHGTFRGRR